MQAGHVKSVPSHTTRPMLVLQAGGGEVRTKKNPPGVGMKQETLAEALGISQQAISKIEQNEIVDETTLGRVAKALGVTTEAIKGFSEESIIYNIQNNYDSASHNSGPNYNCIFNPIDEIKRLNDESAALYKALLKEKDEQIALMQKMLEGKK
jgi:transcriptional regulator with XRE-family HTH domain